MAFLEGSVLQQIMRMHSYRDDKNFFSGLLLSRHVYNGILCRGTQQLFYLFGDANIAKNFLKTWGRLKLSRWPFHSCTIFFEAYTTNSLRFSEEWIFHIFSPPRLGYFVWKRKPKIFGFKKLMKRGIRKILSFLKLYVKLHLKCLGK